MRKSTAVWIVISIILVHYLIAPVFAIYAINNSIYSMYPFPHKTNIGNTNMSLEKPWGIVPNIVVFADLENIPLMEREKYNRSVSLATKFWEDDKTHNLSYIVNFTIVDYSKDANIIIYWNKTVNSNPNDMGYTHINSTSLIDPLGENTCDTYKPPFSKCIIEVKSNLSYKENIFVVNHEIGHALGLEHSLNIIDFVLTNLEVPLMYDFENSEVMFDFKVYDVFKKPYKKLIILFDFFLMGNVLIILFYLKKSKRIRDKLE